MSISPKSGARGLERLPYLKYYDVLKWENRLTLGINTAKSTDYMKKASNKSCWEFNCQFFTHFRYICHVSLEFSFSPGIDFGHSHHSLWMPLPSAPFCPSAFVFWLSDSLCLMIGWLLLGRWDESWKQCSVVSLFLDGAAFLLLCRMQESLLFATCSWKSVVVFLVYEWLPVLWDRYVSCLGLERRCGHETRRAEVPRWRKVDCSLLIFHQSDRGFHVQSYFCFQEVWMQLTIVQCCCKVSGKNCWHFRWVRCQRTPLFNT